MAKRTGSKPLGTAGIVALGAVAGLVLAAWLWPAGPAEPGRPAAGAGEAAAWMAFAGGVIGFLWMLRRRPWKDCPRLDKHSVDREGRTFGVRPDCWVCGGDNRYPRIPTRLLMLFGWQPRR